MAIPLIEIDLRMPMLGLGLDRVLFLDIDGVLHPDGPGDYEDFSCLPVFCEALRAADPQQRLPIVVSSAWRHTQRLDDIKGHFPQDIRDRIIGVTPYLSGTEAASPGTPLRAVRAVASRYTRHNEILAWITRNSAHAQWLAVDDRASGFEDACPQLFLVPGTTREGDGPGITAEVGLRLRTRLESLLDGMPPAAATH